ncbi:hypothetical protein [Streptomyces sp. NPDC003395]
MLLTDLGLHTDRDYQADLDALNTEIDQVTQEIRADRFHSLEARTNAYLKLGSLHARVPVLEWEAEVQNQRLDWIADAARMAGDLVLGAVAYVVYGERVLPC